jgi:tetratricopeptide (TPR) repeat protein
MTKKSAGLPGAIATKVGKQCDLADVAFVEGRLLEAAKAYEKALKMLPAPREQWESGREIMKCAGEAYLAAGDLESAKKALSSAKTFKGADDDEALVLFLTKLIVSGGRRARAPKKAAKKARSRRPSRRASASRPKTTRAKKKKKKK